MKGSGGEGGAEFPLPSASCLHDQKPSGMLDGSEGVDCPEARFCGGSVEESVRRGKQQ